ncbi:hypothetical protein D3C87_516940 [compost metagenome]
MVKLPVVSEIAREDAQPVLASGLNLKPADLRWRCALYANTLINDTLYIRHKKNSPVVVGLFVKYNCTGYLLIFFTMLSTMRG